MRSAFGKAAPLVGAAAYAAGLGAGVFLLALAGILLFFAGVFVWDGPS